MEKSKMKKDGSRIVAKSIQETNSSKLKTSGQNQTNLRKASLGIISPTNNTPLVENKLMFSGSQITTVMQKQVEQHTATKE